MHTLLGPDPDDKYVNGSREKPRLRPLAMKADMRRHADLMNAGLAVEAKHRLPHDTSCSTGETCKMALGWAKWHCAGPHGIQLCPPDRELCLQSCLAEPGRPAPQVLPNWWVWLYLAAPGSIHR